MRDPYLYNVVDILKNLADIKDKELLAKAEADITNLAMLAIYNHRYQKFDTKTLSDIHFTIFGQIYDWAGEFRTIQIVKYEDVLGFDVKHELFKVHSAYVRNALVWASQGIYSKYEYLEKIFFDTMLDDDTGADVEESKGRKYEMIGEYKVKDYVERPHEYVEDDFY